MKALSIGKIRGLQQISTAAGHFIMCAMDHRSGLITMLEDAQHEVPDYDEIVQLKLDMCSTMGAFSSGILLDPEYGAAQCIAGNALSGRTGLLVSSRGHRLRKGPHRAPDNFTEGLERGEDQAHGGLSGKDTGLLPA